MLRFLSPGSCIPHPPGHRLRRPRRRSKKSERHLRRASMLRLLSPGSCIPHPPGHRLRRPRRRSKKSKRHRRRSSMLRLLSPGLHRLLLPSHRYRRLLRLNNRTSRRAVKNMSPQKVSLPPSHDRWVRSPFISVSVPSGGDTSGPRGFNAMIKSWHQRLLGDPDGKLLELVTPGTWPSKAHSLFSMGSFGVSSRLARPV